MKKLLLPLHSPLLVMHSPRHHVYMATLSIGPSTVGRAAGVPFPLRQLFILSDFPHRFTHHGA